MNSQEDGEFRRCRVLHVVPLTFIYGFVKVIFHAVLLVLLCTLLMKPELLEQHEENNKMYGCLCLAKLSRHHDMAYAETKKVESNDLSVVLEIKNVEQKDKLTKIGKVDIDRKSIMRERQITQLYWNLLMTMCYMLFSLMLLHGIMNKNAPNMLPFFCLQLFDFVLDFLWLFGHFISTKNLHKLQAALKCLPLGKYLQSLDPAMASFLVFTVCTFVLLVQLYLIGVVWSCYRYILAKRYQILPTYRNSTNHSPNRNGFWGLELWQVILSPRSSLRKNRLPNKVDEQIEELPNYEEVLKTPINSFNPPPYTDNGEKKSEKNDEMKESQ